MQTVAELATRPQNVEILQNAGVMSLLRPLLLDIVPTIQQTAALALGRLANYNDDLAEAVVKGDILPQLVYSLAEQNVSVSCHQERMFDFPISCSALFFSQQHDDFPSTHINFNLLSNTAQSELQRFYKKAAAFVLRAVAKHSPELAQAVVDCGALDALVICLEEFDPGVKEAAAWALGYIARHNGGTFVNLGFKSTRKVRLPTPTSRPSTSKHCFALKYLLSVLSRLGSGGGRRRRCAAARPLHPRTGNLPQTHFRLSAERYLQTLAGTVADRRRRRGDRAPRANDPQPGRQAQTTGV